jgi:hypothetical protein
LTVGRSGKTASVDPTEAMKTVISDGKSGRALTFTLRPEFVGSNKDLPHERLEGEGRRVAGLHDDEIFSPSE